MSKCIYLKDLKIHIFNPYQLKKGDTKTFNRSYKLWKQVWSQTFSQLEGDSTVYSDDFNRQQDIISILFNDHPIALIFMNYLDFHNPPSWEDSYFRPWTEADIKELIKNGKKVVIGSNITVHPNFRGPIVEGMSLKNLALDMSSKRLLEKDYDVMTGTMRCNKGMENSAYNCGATPIKKGVVFHNVAVDLVAFYKSNIKLIYPEQSQSLWQTKIENKTHRPTLKVA